MRRQYDFSKGRKNPYAARLKRSVTIRLDTFTVDYFKSLADDTGIAYQTLINLYLRECAGSGRRLAMEWRPAKQGAA
ncbi:MAG: BrnA antitoxin family protein [Gemmatimonadaceae bacterium]